MKYLKMFENFNKKETSLSYDDITSIIQKMIDNNEISINLPLKDIVHKFVPLHIKYDRFSLEELILDIAVDKGFMSENHVRNMGEYIKIFKDKFGVDTSTLEKLYPTFNEYIKTETTQLGETDNEYNKRMKRYYKLQDSGVYDNFINEFKRLAKIVATKL